MVSPMREKRTWPPQDKDSDGETVAAFEAAVAVVKETVVRSGEVLVSAKEDLNDHQRWLKAQTAKVAADRQRHDRFLHRQRERQETLSNGASRSGQRRRAKRQAAARSIKDAVSAAIYAVRSAVSARSGACGGRRDLCGAFGGLAGGRQDHRRPELHRCGGGIRPALDVGVGSLWRALCGRPDLTWRELCRRSGPLTRPLALGRCCRRALRRSAPRSHAAAPSVGNFLSLCFGGIAARTRDVSRAMGRGLGAGLSGVSAKADVLTRQAGEALGPAMSSIAARAHALAPSLTERIGQARQGGALRVQSLLRVQGPRGRCAARPIAVDAGQAAPAVESENAVSSPRAVREI